MELHKIIAAIILSLLPIAVVLVNYFVVALGIAKLVNKDKTPWWVWVIATPITLLLVIIYYFVFRVTPELIF